MRRLLGKVRGSFVGRIVPLDDAIDLHRVLGHTLFVVAVLHALAFGFAYANGHTGISGIFATKRGLTGAIWLGTFAVMWAFSLSVVRKSKHFELFYFTHLLYVPWLLLALLHAPRLALFAGVAFAGFVIENLLRWMKRRSSSPVVSTWPLRSGVTRLEIERPKGFTFEAGDFVFLRIPAVAKHEWHPYTISSAPEAPDLVFHVRSLGNWSSAVRTLAETKPAKGAIEAYVDGPYGTPSAPIFRSRFVVLIGAGIGVTPFASVLESIVARTGSEREQAEPSALEKVHFFWLNRDAYSFEWFRGMLSRLESLDHRGLVDIHLCMTQGRAGVTALGLELARDLMSSAGRSDIMTGLRTRTHFGHPDWEGMLGAIARRHAPDRVDVFFCGPHGLSRVLEPLCHRLGMGFREERF
jgi:predicted ferric reductase